MYENKVNQILSDIKEKEILQEKSFSNAMAEEIELLRV